MSPTGSGVVCPAGFVVSPAHGYRATARDAEGGMWGLVLSAIIPEQGRVTEWAGGLDSPEAHIDLAAIVANWRMLASLAPGADACAVVKADAYGLGAAPAARALAKAGCRRFYVAWPQEGATLRGALGAGPEIAILNGFAGDGAQVFRDFDLQPVLNSMQDVKDWIAMGAGRHPAALHLDTGMSRLGLAASEWAGAADMLSGAAPARIMSHLACGDEPGHAMNARQLQRFTEGAAIWPGVARSFAATAGVYLGPDYTFEEIRPGVGLYGGGPAPPEGRKLSNVLTLRTPVLQVREIAGGDTVGYGATWSATGPMRTATIGIGYADGFLRAASNRGYAVIQGEKRPILGRVSMDLVVLDVTGLSVNQGDPVELIGASMPIADQAAAMSTIDYELLTRIGARVRRQYTGEA